MFYYQVKTSIWFKQWMHWQLLFFKFC